MSSICLHTVFCSNQLQIKQYWFYRNIPIQCNQRSTVFTQCKITANLHFFTHQNATKCITNNITAILERCRLVNSSLPQQFKLRITTLIARFLGPTWGPSGADRTQMGPMLAPWTLLSGKQPSVWSYLLRFYYRSAFNINWTRAKYQTRYQDPSELCV